MATLARHVLPAIRQPPKQDAMDALQSTGLQSLRKLLLVLDQSALSGFLEGKLLSTLSVVRGLTDCSRMRRPLIFPCLPSGMRAA